MKDLLKRALVLDAVTVPITADHLPHTTGALSQPIWLHHILPISRIPSSVRSVNLYNVKVSRSVDPPPTSP